LINNADSQQNQQTDPDSNKPTDFYQPAQAVDNVLVNFVRSLGANIFNLSSAPTHPTA
jgi:hypothetical protein